MASRTVPYGTDFQIWRKRPYMADPVPYRTVRDFQIWQKCPYMAEFAKYAPNGQIRPGSKVKGHDVKVKGHDVRVKGHDVKVKGHDVRVKGQRL